MIFISCVHYEKKTNNVTVNEIFHDYFNGCIMY